MLDTVNPIATGIRMMFMSFDIGIFWLLRFIFELFFNITTFSILDRKMIFDVFSKVQLILGVFMMFQLVMIIIKGIIDPDSVTDSKSGGAGAIVKRIIVSIALLALLVPVNIASPQNEYERQINNNGILFGTLYSLQYRILTNNTLGKLILGDESTNYTSKQPQTQALSSFADDFTTTIVKTFYTLNMGEDGKKYVCGDGWDKTYQNEKSAFIIIAAGVRQCNENVVTGATKLVQVGSHYSLSMSYLIGTVAGVILVVVMFMMCFEVAKRVFQLAALQLIAPIPIISYMDPKGSKDGAFSSWVKLLTSTYIELFVRLAVIYFSIAVIQAFSNKFFNLNNAVDYAVETVNGAALNAPALISWTFIVMCIALFIFAKDAPKFFKQMLGVKDNGKGFFDSFSKAMGLGTAAVGAIGSARTGFRTAAEENAKLHQGSKLNGLRNFGSALAAGIGGGYAGVKAALGDKGGVASVMDAQRKHRADRANHKTFLRGLTDDVLSTATGESPAEAGKKRIANHKAFQDAQKNWKSALETEAINNGAVCDLGGGVMGKYRDLINALENNTYEKKDAHGNSLGKFIKLKNQYGVEVEHSVDKFTSKFKEDALKAQISDWQHGNHDGDAYADLIKVGQKLYITHETVKTAKEKVGTYVIESDDPNVIAQSATLKTNFDSYNVDDVTTYGKAVGASNAAKSAEENNMRNVIRNANTKENKN